MRITNLSVRVIIANSGLTYKQIAYEIGVTPEYLSRVMGRPLKPEMWRRIKQAVETLTGREVGEDGETE